LHNRLRKILQCDRNVESFQYFILLLSLNDVFNSHWSENFRFQIICLLKSLFKVSLFQEVHKSNVLETLGFKTFINMISLELFSLLRRTKKKISVERRFQWDSYICSNEHFLHLALNGVFRSIWYRGLRSFQIRNNWKLCSFHFFFTQTEIHKLMS